VLKALDPAPRDKTDIKMSVVDRNMALSIPIADFAPRLSPPVKPAIPTPLMLAAWLEPRH
jgi:hypothetical protein